MKNKALLALTGLSAAILPTATAKAEGLPSDTPQPEPETLTAEQQAALLQAVQASQPEPVKFVAPVDVYACVNPETLPVMAGPGESYGISMTLNKNQSVHITGATADFYRIDMGLTEGYIRQSMVTIGTVPNEIEVPPVNTSVEPTNLIATAKTDVNYRTGPGTGHDVAGVLPKGNTVSITGITENGWYVIPGPEGNWYAKSNLLNAEEVTANGNVPAANIPVKDIPDIEPEHKEQSEEERLSNMLKASELSDISKKQAEKAAASAERAYVMSPEEQRLNSLLDNMGKDQLTEASNIINSIPENVPAEVRPYIEAAKESYAQAEALTEKARLEEILNKMEQDKAASVETKIQEELKKQEEAAKNPAIQEIVPTEQGTKDRAAYEAANPDYHYDWEQVAPPETYNGETPEMDLSYKFPVPDDYYDYYTLPEETPVIPEIPTEIPAPEASEADTEQVTEDTESNEITDFLETLERMQQEQELNELAQEVEEDNRSVTEPIGGDIPDAVLSLLPQPGQATEETDVEEAQIGSLEAAPVASSEVELLAKLIIHEAGGEGTEGRRGVAEVVINRMESPRFPNTLEGVIYQKHQFENAYKVKSHKVDSEAIAIAKEYLSKHYAGSSAGDMFPSSVLYFRNAVTCGADPYTNWGKLPFYKKINHHTFYSQA